MREGWSRQGIGCSVLIASTGLLAGCGRSAAGAEPIPDVRVRLGQYGLPSDYARLDGDDCTSHVIGYRAVVWLSSDRVAVAYNVSPNCRLSADRESGGGTLRIVVFDTHGEKKASRDIAYAADGGAELVAPGEVNQGPDGTLLLRIEEARGATSGVRLLGETLQEVAQVDRFMERESPIDRSLVFQDGVVWHGPRTYDVFDRVPLGEASRVTVDDPVGSMDRQVGARGAAYVVCEQELALNRYGHSNVISSGAHRRCETRVQVSNGDQWRISA